MNTHDLGLALNRPGVCADAGFVILNSYSSFQIKFFQHSHLLRGLVKYLIHMGIG